MKFSVIVAALLAFVIGTVPVSVEAKKFNPFGSVEGNQFKSKLKHGKHASGKKAKRSKSASKSKSRKAAKASGKSKAAKSAKTPQNIAQIRDAAIRSTVAGLAPLKNYSTNYKGMVAAVRSYWTRNIRKPSAGALAATILRYVDPAYRKYAASEVRAGAAEGVASVKLALRAS